MCVDAKASVNEPLLWYNPLREETNVNGSLLGTIHTIELLWMSYLMHQNTTNKEQTPFLAAQGVVTQLSMKRWKYGTTSH